MLVFSQKSYKILKHLMRKQLKIKGLERAPPPPPPNLLLHGIQGLTYP